MTTGLKVVVVGPIADGGGSIPDLSPREAFERWIARLRTEHAESTVSAYHYRVKHFIEWCEDNGIASMGELTGWTIESFETHRREQGLKTITLNNELDSLKDFTRYCARIELVDEDLPEKIQPPSVPRSEQVDQTRLTPDRAKSLLDYYEADPDAYGTRAHALLALAWYTGARLGGLRTLDVDDYYSEESYVSFRHRPEEGTPLKRGLDGERVVGLPDQVCDVIDKYLREHRLETYDDYGRRPLLTSQLGRGSTGGIRGWMYLATVPCLHDPCPHGNDPGTCEYLDYNSASQCPSSRSPHQVRSGSITWQLNRGIPIEDVAERVNSSIPVLKRHYDLAGKVEAMQERRSDHLDRLTFDGQGGDDE